MKLRNLCHKCVSQPKNGVEITHALDTKTFKKEDVNICYRDLFCILSCATNRSHVPITQTT